MAKSAEELHRNFKAGFEKLHRLGVQVLEEKLGIDTRSLATQYELVARNLGIQPSEYKALDHLVRLEVLERALTRELEVTGPKRNGPSVWLMRKGNASDEEAEA